MYSTSNLFMTSCLFTLRAPFRFNLLQAEKYFDGLLDILVNNVGTSIRKATVDYTPEELAHVMDTNFTSLFLLTQVRHWLNAT